jgi:hypothetical protein
MKLRAAGAISGLFKTGLALAFARSESNGNHYGRSEFAGIRGY